MRAPAGWRLIAAQHGYYYIIEWRKDGRMGKSLGPFKGKSKAVAAAKKWRG